MPAEAQDLETSERVPRRWQSTDRAVKNNDVFCMVKQTMAAEGLSQSPLLVMPGTMLAESENFIRVANTTALVDTPQYDKERLDEFELLRAAIAHDFPHMSRAVAWYQTILDRKPDDPSEAYPDLSFLRSAPADSPCLHDFRLGDRPLPPRPHNLQVVFHRERAAA